MSQRTVRTILPAILMPACLVLLSSAGPAAQAPDPPRTSPPAAAQEAPPQPPRAVLTGSLISADGGAPIASALVEVIPLLDTEAARSRRAAGEFLPSPIAVGVTDLAGAFRISVPADQRAIVAARAPGFQRGRYRRAVIVGGADETRDLGRLDLMPGRTLTGRTVNGKGDPVAGATVLATYPRPAGRARPRGLLARRFAAMDATLPYPVTAVSAADGTFTIEGISADADVTLRAFADGMAPALRRDAGRSGGVLMTLDPGHVVRGRVVAPDGKTPVASAWVLAGEEGWDGLARTDEKGNFTLPHLRPGETTLVATVSSAIAGKVYRLPPAAHWAPSAATRIRTPLAPEAPGAPDAPATTLALRPGAVIHARAVDAATRAPLAGALFMLDAPGEAIARPAPGGPSGEVTWTGVPAGGVDLRADAAGYLAHDAAPVDLAAGEARPVTLALDRAASVAGTVRDATGRPIAGAQVTVAGPPPFASPMPMAIYFPIGVPPVGTDAQGRFRIDALPPRSDLKIAVTFAGYVPWEMTGVTLRAGERREGLEVLLDAGSMLSGRLVDQEGSPVAGATISGERRQEGNRADMVVMVGERRGGRTRTMGGPGGSEGAIPISSDDEGVFRLAGLKPGIWSLTIKAPGYAPKEIAGLKIEAPGDAVDAGEIVLEPGVTLTGYVTNAAGSPIPFAQGSLRERFSILSEFTAGSDGHFVSEDLAAGDTFDLQVGADGYANVEMAGLSVPREPLTLVLPPSSTVSGEVIDEESREPLRDFSITISRTRSMGGGGMQFSMQTAMPEVQFQSDDGTFTVEDVDPGKITVRATAPAHKETTLADLNVPEGENLTGLRILMARAAHIAGVVTDDRGSPLANVSVERKQTTGGMMMMRGGGGDATTTDGDGAFHLGGLERGPMTITFTHSGFETAERDVDTTQDVDGLRVTMTRGADLVGMVLMQEDGAPVAGATVTATAAGSNRFGNSSTARTASDGTFTIPALSEGRYAVRAEADGLSGASADDVVVTAGLAPPPVELRLGGGVTLTGQVTGLRPEELPKFNVSSVATGGGFGVTAAVDASGAFRMKGMRPGPTTLIARSGIFGGRSKTHTVEIPEGVATFETVIEFPRGVIVEGHVTRGGEPVDGASVVFVNTKSRASLTVEADAGGHYVAEDVEKGDYDIMVMHFRSGSTHNTTASIQDDRVLDIELPLARLAGTVIDSTSGRPIDKARIGIRKIDGEATSQRMGLILSRGASTDATGAWAIEGLDSGTYELTASASGFGHEMRQAAIIPGSAPSDIPFVLNRTEGLSFRAVDGSTGLVLRAISGIVLAGGGDPLAPGGAQASVVAQGRWSADASGIFHLDSLSSGRYTLVLGGEGIGTTTLRDVESPAAGGSFTLQPGGNLEITSASLAAGETARAVILEASGRAIHTSTFFADPAITLRGGQPNTISNLPAGSWRLRLAGPDGSIRDHDVTVTPGSTTRIDLP